MYIFITVLIIIISILLGLIVLIQNPKGGGVSSTFGGASQQIFGAARTTDVVEKTTWTLATLLLVFSIFSAFFLGKTTVATTARGNAVPTTTGTPQLSEPEQRAKEKGVPMPTQTAPPAQQGRQPQPTK
jgi:preprotein translocase subunit SecG